MYSIDDTMNYMMSNDIHYTRLRHRFDGWFETNQSRYRGVLTQFPHNFPSWLQFPSSNDGLFDNPLTILQKVQMTSEALNSAHLWYKAQTVNGPDQTHNRSFCSQVTAIIFPVCNQNSQIVILLFGRISDEDLPKIVEFIRILSKIERESQQKDLSSGTLTVEATDSSNNKAINMDNENGGEKI